jgi:hypothetical protein
MGTHHCRKSMAMVVAWVVVMPMLLWHCSRHEDIIGNYHAVDADRQGRMSVTLELQANGKGLWSIETDNAPFRWDRRQNKIRLHTIRRCHRRNHRQPDDSPGRYPAWG